MAIAREVSLNVAAPLMLADAFVAAIVEMVEEGAAAREAAE